MPYIPSLSYDVVLGYCACELELGVVDVTFRIIE